MTEETSQRTGAKPIILAPMGDELLCHYLFGKNTDPFTPMLEVDDDDQFEILEESVVEEESNIKIQAPHFGAGQVVIVRSQAVKEELPEFLRSMLCLTVYEAKGLEFDDVILFNFFAMGEIRLS